MYHNRSLVYITCYLSATTWSAANVMKLLGIHVLLLLIYSKIVLFWLYGRQGGTLSERNYKALSI